MRQYRCSTDIVTEYSKHPQHACAPSCSCIFQIKDRTTQPISRKSEQICNRSVKTCCQQADIWMRSLALYLSVLTGPQRLVNRSVIQAVVSCGRAAAMLFSTGMSQVVDKELQQCCFQQLATDLTNRGKRLSFVYPLFWTKNGQTGCHILVVVFRKITRHFYDKLAI
jgi:hypothetical protein